MYYEQVEKINADLARTRRAIITLGDSFTQGQGAIDQEMWDRYEWSYSSPGGLVPVITPEQETQLLVDYPMVRKKYGALDFSMMEYKNAYPNILGSRYFEGGYAVINLGIRGCGNRSTVKELYFHPEIDWHLANEKIVIYCLSGPERFDFASDEWAEHNRWVCMWPNFKGKSQEPRKILEEGYSRAIFSEKASVLEQIGHMQEVMTWCKLHNAKLIVVSAFNKQYTRECFHRFLLTRYTRNRTGELENTKPYVFQDRLAQEYNMLIDLWPWDLMFFPEGKPTFIDVCMAREFPDDWQDRHFWNYNGSLTPQKYLSICSHPTAKSHDIFAKLLHEHIIRL
jgi:hypothetical protein